MGTDRNYCAIDFETACADRASACAVGLARVRDGRIAETFISLIKPPEGTVFSPICVGIHGIRPAAVRAAPSFAELWPALSAFIGDDCLVAHNAAFDRSVLRACLERWGIEARFPDFECTVVLSRRAWPDFYDHKLGTVCGELGIELDHHDALSDAKACARILVEARRRLGA